MILKGSQRSGGRQLAAHLLNTRDNEHVELHELRGFSADDLDGALQEAYAVSRGTRAKQYLFSLSLNPPPQERVKTEAFEAAIAAVEGKLGLENQPRAIVFHEKEGRRHAHVVWSRIDADKMKAINLPHFKLRLRDVSRQLYLEHGWKMPRGLANSKERDPRNFNRQEWEQAKRAELDPKALKGMFQECWAMSDSGQAYAQALTERGYTLARGDRQDVVALDFRGQVYAVAKWTGLKAKETRGKLESLKDLPSVAQAQATIAARMTEALRGYVAEAQAARRAEVQAMAEQRTHLINKQRKERADLAANQEKRHARETVLRASRLNKGVRGLWDRLIGRRAKQVRENEREASVCAQRDRREKDAQIEGHLEERGVFHRMARQQRQARQQDMAQLHRDIAEYTRMAPAQAPSLKGHFNLAAQGRAHGAADTGKSSAAPGDRGRGMERSPSRFA